MALNRRFLFVLILMLALACPGRAASNDYVRLHVVAADDSAPAQALKLRVRDAAVDVRDVE